MEEPHVKLFAFLTIVFVIIWQRRGRQRGRTGLDGWMCLHVCSHFMHSTSRLLSGVCGTARPKTLEIVTIGSRNTDMNWE